MVRPPRIEIGLRVPLTQAAVRVNTGNLRKTIDYSISSMRDPVRFPVGKRVFWATVAQDFFIWRPQTIH